MVMGRRQRPASGAAERRLLTAVELELMNILWRLGEGTVRAVMAELPRGRELAYTSVSTMLRILEQKEFVTSRKEGRGHVYVPAIPKSEYERTALRQVVGQVFDGAAVPLVRRLLEQEKLTKADLAELREIVRRVGR
jgi:predicted transcriptional regulator